MSICARLAYGDGFLQLNKQYLDRYAACCDSEQIDTEQKKIIAELQQGPEEPE